MKCIWSDDINHKYKDCRLYTNTMKDDIITFKEDKIRDAIKNEPLDANFEKKSMKKSMDDRLKRNNSSHGKEVETYTIEAEYIKIKTSTNVSKEVMVKKAQAIRTLIK